MIYSAESDKVIDTAYYEAGDPFTGYPEEHYVEEGELWFIPNYCGRLEQRYIRRFKKAPHYFPDIKPLTGTEASELL